MTKLRQAAQEAAFAFAAFFLTGFVSLMWGPGTVPDLNTARAVGYPPPLHRPCPSNRCPQGGTSSGSIRGYAQPANSRPDPCEGTNGSTRWCDRTRTRHVEGHPQPGNEVIEISLTRVERQIDLGMDQWIARPQPSGATAAGVQQRQRNGEARTPGRDADIERDRARVHLHLGHGLVARRGKNAQASAGLVASGESTSASAWTTLRPGRGRRREPLWTRHTATACRSSRRQGRLRPADLRGCPSEPNDHLETLIDNACAEGWIARDVADVLGKHRNPYTHGGSGRTPTPPSTQRYCSPRSSWWWPH